MKTRIIKLREKIISYMGSEDAPKAANIGTIVNIAFFILLFLAEIPTFAMVNIVDFEGPDLYSIYYSTFLFLTVSFWIYFAAKVKCTKALNISAAFMFITSVIYFGYGLFQPCFYTLLKILSIPFGGSFSNFEPFDSIENGAIDIFFCILLCVLDKFAHIYLGCVALKYKNIINNDMLPQNERTEVKSDKKLLLVRIPLYIGLALTAIVIIEDIVWSFIYWCE